MTLLNTQSEFSVGKMEIFDKKPKFESICSIGDKFFCLSQVKINDTHLFDSDKENKAINLW